MEIILLLPNIRSTFNVGSIFRTADGFGVKKIILSGYTPYPNLNLVGKDDSRLPHIKDHDRLGKAGGERPALFGGAGLPGQWI